MKWDGDPFREQKYLILDAIIKFSFDFRDKDASKISVRQLSEFIDKFMNGRK